MALCQPALLCEDTEVLRHSSKVRHLPRTDLTSPNTHLSVGCCAHPAMARLIAPRNHVTPYGTSKEISQGTFWDSPE